jgi:hypothetical protein
MFATFARVEEEEEEEALPRRCRDIEYLVVKNTKNSPVSSRAKSTHT